MKILAQKDSGIKPFREKISKYVQAYESMGLNFWLFVQESTPIALFFFGKEPINLISPPGTPMGMIQILDYDKSKNHIEGIIIEVLSIGKERNVDYLFVSSIPKAQSEIVYALKKIGFKEKDCWYKMEMFLDNIQKPQEIIKLKKVEREKVKKFLESAEHCTSGAYEGEAMHSLSEIPDILLNFWYDMQEFYYAYKDKQMIGILTLTPGSEFNLTNIGVTPNYRSKGYGKQILLLALERLKKLNKEKVGLRVHVQNTRAKSLYESLGFKTTDQQIDLIRWKENSYKK